MMIKRFSNIEGYDVSNIDGQSRFDYALSDFEDLYEIPEIIDHNGYYRGSTINFYDFETGDVHIPFDHKKNVAYTHPVFYNGTFYFLKADFDRQVVLLVETLPGDYPNKIWEEKVENLNLYNLFPTVGKEIYVTSSDEKFIAYYPETFELDLKAEESVTYIDKDKIYLQAWIEEGIVDDQITVDYKYYEKIRVIDRKGQVLSEEIGCLTRSDQDEWWIS